MSREFCGHPTEGQPSQAVKEEAAKIIQTLDGRINSPWYIDNPEYDQNRAYQAREMLIKDSQTLSPKDMKDLIRTVMDGEDKKRGYDLEIYGPTKDDPDQQKRILVLTHHSAPGEYGEPARTPGATIEVTTAHWVNGLPDFKIVDQHKK